MDDAYWFGIEEEFFLADAATRAGIGPWIEANRVLMQRSVNRGEFPPADVETLAQVIPMMCISRAVQQEPITREFSLALLDSVIIPARRGGRRPSSQPSLTNDKGGSYKRH